MNSATLEVCVDDMAGLEACLSGGADRVELCSALALGGLTPSPGFMRAASTIAIPVYAMIRPRAGDFGYSPAEIDIMCDDIACARNCGLEGVVLGAATADRALDRVALARLCDAASGMGRTLHRVVDTLAEPIASIEAAIDLGFERVLTSGTTPRAVEGLPTLKAMQRRAAGKIEIMAGGGITAQNVRQIMAATGIRSVHASCRSNRSDEDLLISLGFSQPDDRYTDVKAIRQLKAVMVR